MEWVAIAPATLILAAGAGPPFAFRNENRLLPVAVLIACVASFSALRSLSRSSANSARPRRDRADGAPSPRQSTRREFAGNRKPCLHVPSASGARRPGSACSRPGRFGPGSDTVTYRGKRIPTAEAQERERRFGAKYMFGDRPPLDHLRPARLPRHQFDSCDANAEARLRNGRMVFVALRCIAPGEEITLDYGEEYFDLYLRASGCRCAACRAKADARRRKPATAKKTLPATAGLLHARFDAGHSSQILCNRPTGA